MSRDLKQIIEEGIDLETGVPMIDKIMEMRESRDHIVMYGGRGVGRTNFANELLLAKLEKELETGELIRVHFPVEGSAEHMHRMTRSILDSFDVPIVVTSNGDNTLTFEKSERNQSTIVMNSMKKRILTAALVGTSLSIANSCQSPLPRMSYNCYTPQKEYKPMEKQKVPVKERFRLARLNKFKKE